MNIEIEKVVKPTVCPQRPKLSVEEINKELEELKKMIVLEEERRANKGVCNQAMEFTENKEHKKSISINDTGPKFQGVEFKKVKMSNTIDISEDKIKIAEMQTKENIKIIENNSNEEINNYMKRNMQEIDNKKRASLHMLELGQNEEIAKDLQEINKDENSLGLSQDKNDKNIEGNLKESVVGNLERIKFAEQSCQEKVFVKEVENRDKEVVMVVMKEAVKKLDNIADRHESLYDEEV